ncbi:hypothetical protein [Cohnella zeiphila]|uniref:Uncharacterized protein n=1 Tax=Cohnella zeiphila TaxID=2761120 RepID=A0A7X0SHH8_9BACL|nr:hypothetical protein [Cohnella zeiphila]MBB6730077.1 hypothetical protein [Cohnella zeiphila]
MAEPLERLDSERGITRSEDRMDMEKSRMDRDRTGAAVGSAERSGTSA